MSKANAYFTVNDVNDNHDVKKLKKELDTLPGVTSVSVSIKDETQSIVVDFDTTAVNQEQLKKKIEKLGYEIKDTCFENYII